MKHQQTAGHSSFGHLDQREKREYLSVLCDVVWDIELELAQAKAERAALMRSLQTNLDGDSRDTASLQPPAAGPGGGPAAARGCVLSSAR